MWYSAGPAQRFLASCFQNKWILYAIIAILCWLMVSGVKFIKMMPSKWNISHTWPQLVLVIFTAICLPLLSVAAIPLGFVLYVLLSFVYKQPETTENNN